MKGLMPRMILLFLALYLFTGAQGVWAASKEVQRANTYLKAGKRTLAVNTLEASLDRNPMDYDANWLLATLYLEQGDYEKAKQKFDTVIKLKPAQMVEVVALLRKFSATQLENNRLSEAQAAFEQAMLYDPSLRGAQRFYLKLAQKTLDQTKKIDYAEKALQYAVTSADRNALAKLYLQMALATPAMRQTYRQKAVQIAGPELVDQAFPRTTPVVVFDRMYSDADINRDSGSITVFKWDAQIKTGDRLDVVGILPGKTRFEEDYEIGLNTGQSYEPGWITTTNGCYSLVIEQVPAGSNFQMRFKRRKNIVVRVRITRDVQPRVNLAVLDTQVIPEDLPIEGKDYMRAARGFVREKKFAEADQAYDLALMQDPENAENHFIVGQYYYQRGEFQRAQERFFSAYKLDPKTGPRIAQIYENAGEIALMSLDNETVDKAKENYLKADYYLGATGAIAQRPFDKGAASVKQGALDPALKYFDVAVSINAKLGDQIGDLILAQAAKADSKYRMYYYETAAKYSPRARTAIFNQMMATANALPPEKEKEIQYWRDLAAKFGNVPTDYAIYKPGRYIFRLKKGETQPALWIRTQSGTRATVAYYSNNDRYEVLQRIGNKVSIIRVWKGEPAPPVERRCDLKFRGTGDTTLGLEITEY
ncbi:MAG: tetratricopeptide repeat protein [Syntrophaceae bacterium]